MSVGVGRVSGGVGERSVSAKNRTLFRAKNLTWRGGLALSVG